MIDDVAVVRAKLIEHLVREPNGLQGAKLADRLRQGMRGFAPADYGARNIKEFIESNVPEISVVGRAGADVIYALRTNREPSETPAVGRQQLPVGAMPQLSLWTVWATPTTSYAIDIDAEGCALVVRPSEVTHQRLNSLAAERHRQIAESFLDKFGTTLEPEQLSRLSAAAQLPLNHWWSAWIKALNWASATNETWLRFRMEYLQISLDEDLSTLELSPEARLRAGRSIRESRRPRQTFNVNNRIGDRLSVPNRSRLLQIVLEAVNTLDEADLRQIKLPVGIVFDIMSNSSR